MTAAVSGERQGGGGVEDFGPGEARSWPEAPRRSQVLLLEDNTALARALRWAVVACSEVTAVVTAAEARACLDREWDAFVFDIGLPDGSGLDVLRQARLEQPDAAALAISGSIKQEDVNAAFAMGAHYLAKPFKPEALVAFLERSLRSSRPARQGSQPPQERDGIVTPLLPPQLGRLVADVRASAATTVTAESEYTHCLALLARAASAGEGLSAATFEGCAKAAEVSRQTLQEYVTLTTRWEPEMVARLVGSLDRCGRTVTRAHLLRIARGPSAVRMAFDEAVGAEELDLKEILGRLG